MCSELHVVSFVAVSHFLASHLFFSVRVGGAVGGLFLACAASGSRVRVRVQVAQERHAPCANKDVSANRTK